MIKIDRAKIFSNGIDRVDNTKGYTEDNIVTCCILCNRAKSDMPQSEFIEWISCVYNHLNKLLDIPKVS